MWWAVALAGLASACGRIGFDPLADATPAALVQVQAPGYQSATGVTVEIALTAGNFAVVATYWNQVPDMVALVDTTGLAWTPLAIQEIVASCGGGTGNATGARLWYAQVTATAMDQITVEQTSGTQPLGAFVLEYAGIATADAVDAASGQLAPAASANASVPAFTTTGTDVIVAFFGDTLGMGSWTPGDGYTAEARDTGFPNLIEDAIMPPGTYIPDAMLPPGHNDPCWVGTAAAFRTR
jgi:hypothetical protein